MTIKIVTIGHAVATNPPPQHVCPWLVDVPSEAVPE